jgi:hypothetical protein
LASVEKINWREIATVFLTLLNVILLIVLFAIKALNFILELIGILLGSFKLVSKADDDK